MVPEPDIQDPITVVKSAKQELALPLDTVIGHPVPGVSTIVNDTYGPQTAI